ncbi:MAG: cytochrome c family protein [Alphaproteobacteria bacterium]|nr:cytochrome c family protein [Alphaproteobacteria bacterium]
MDSFELNKIAGGVIAALLVIVGTKTIIETSNSGHGGHGDHAAVGYVLPKPEADGDGHGKSAKAGAPAAAAFDATKVAALVGAADVASGEKLFKKCKACHTADKGGANKVGPNLFGVVDRAKGGVDGFGYSDALKAKGGVWDAEALVAFLHKPKEYIPGTKMVFKGFKKDAELADITAYLASLK